MSTPSTISVLSSLLTNNVGAHNLRTPQCVAIYAPMGVMRLLVLNLFVLQFSIVSASPLENHDVKTSFRRGIELLRKGVYDEALVFFDNARQEAPTWALPHLHWGIIKAMLEPDSPLAHAALQKAVSLAPDNPRAHYQLGLSFERLQQYPQAIAHYEAALRLRPSMNQVRFRMAHAYQQAGEHNTAIENYEAVLAQRANHI
ncbi:MAG: tetratricopeptide repeat protein, partial [Myxococcota bacterium]